ncbi:hypothetical protein [Nitrosomonas sp.]|uniref:hypothetical protein n=1 Tax=Nitrosomonas sp. TaxID=42353 RepID=UPI00272F089F|nr:hypothetical protein [Nitrosomonas sp.]MDP2224197.1 hypothetical protein [Nitrosomonas sp.]
MSLINSGHFYLGEIGHYYLGLTALSEKDCCRIGIKPIWFQFFLALTAHTEAFRSNPSQRGLKFSPMELKAILKSDGHAGCWIASIREARPTLD